MDENQERYEIDLLQMARDLLKRWYIIAITTIIGGVIAFGYTNYYLTPRYTANVLMYVNNATSSSSGSGSWTTYTDFYTARYLLNNYLEILKSRSTLEAIQEEAAPNVSIGTLSGMINGSIKEDTEIISINVTHEDPVFAAKIANAVTKVLPNEIKKIITSSNAKIVDEAVIPTSQSFPDDRQNIMVGILLGFGLGAISVIIFEFFNDEIKNDEWISRTYGESIPLLAIIPDLNDKGMYGYKRYGRYGKYGYYSAYKSYQGRSAK